MRTESEGFRAPGWVRALVTTLVAVLIIGIGVAGWALWGRTLPLGEASIDAAGGEAGRVPEDRLVLADLGGAKENYARIDDFTGVRGMKILTRAEQDVYQRAKVTRAKVGVANYNDDAGKAKATVVLVRAESPQAARTAADALAGLQTGFGFTAAPDARPGVAAGLLRGRPGDKPPVPGGGRAHYVHDDVLVRVEVRGDPDDVVRKRFDGVLDGQLDLLAADA